MMFLFGGVIIKYDLSHFHYGHFYSHFFCFEYKVVLWTYYKFAKPFRYYTSIPVWICLNYTENQIIFIYKMVFSFLYLSSCSEFLQKTTYCGDKTNLVSYVNVRISAIYSALFHKWLLKLTRTLDHFSIDFFFFLASVYTV